MTERPTPPFLEALQAFHDALVELGAPFTFIGGVAVIARFNPFSFIWSSSMRTSSTHQVNAPVFVRHLRSTDTGTMSSSPRRRARR